MAARLVTIPFSHYCEKARWALDRAGLAYVEDGHLPIFSWRPARKAGGKRTVPVLVTDDGRVLDDSTDILRHCDEHGAAPPLFPPGDADVVELEDDFDRRLGPAARRVAYFHLLPSKAAFRELLDASVPAWQRRAGRIARPLAAALIKRGLRIDAAGAARSAKILDETFARVAERLADGRRYLAGDRLTAADLTFASLAAPVLAPPQYGARLPSEGTCPAPFLAMRDGYRRHPAGAFALRVYERDRAARPAATLSASA